MKKTIRIDLHEEDLVQGASKSPTNDNLTLHDFNVPIEEFFKADIIVYSNSFCGKVLKDRNNTGVRV